MALYNSPIDSSTGDSHSRQYKSTVRKKGIASAPKCSINSLIAHCFTQQLQAFSEAPKNGVLGLRQRRYVGKPTCDTTRATH